MKIPLRRIKKIKTFGMSMYPLLFDGDIVYLTKTSKSQIKLNDIVCVMQNKKMFTHRVIYKTTKFIITKGDNNVNTDRRIKYKNIIGRVDVVKRGNQFLHIDQLYLFQSTIYFAEIKRILSQFTKKKLDYVILKGLPLHLYYSGAHPRRLYADCDVLIRENAFFKVEKLLILEGYSKIDSSLSIAQKFAKRRNPETSFVKVINGIAVVFDIHIEVVFLMTQLGSLDLLYSEKNVKKLTKELFDNSCKITVLGEQFKVLSNEYLFLYLCLHLFHHNFKMAHNYEFIYQVWNKKVNFEEISKIINNYQLESFIYPSLLLLQKYYFITFPKTFFEKVIPSREIQHYVTRNILDIDLFNSETRIKSGIVRFRNIFNLSPYNFPKKVLVFFNTEVLLALFFTLYTVSFNILRKKVRRI